MAWLGVIVTGICGLSFFVSAEWAAGLKEGKFRSKAALGSSVLFLFGCIAGLVCFPPAEGIARLITVSIMGASSLACCWFAKSHSDHFRTRAANVSGSLGLVLLVVGFMVFFERMPEWPLVIEVIEPQAMQTASDTRI